MNMTSAISLSYAAGITEMPEAVLQDARAGPGETSFADCLQGEMDKSAFSRGESEGDVPAFAVGAKARESEAVIEEKADEIIFSFISPDVFSPKGEAPIVPKRRTLSESGTEGTALSAATEGGQRPETAVNVSGKTEVYVEGKRADADGKTARFAVNAPAFADGFSEKTARAASVRDYANDASGGDYANAAPDGNYANAAPDGN
ncbi:MAG: hypothetical protein LBI36_06550, partial [Oscillospiraceae bacterium]|nr:hypothetical protein [Oscillospiraceae bacterium]